MTYNPFIDRPYPVVHTEGNQQQEDSLAKMSDFNNPKYNMERHSSNEAKSKMKQSQELHQFKILQQKNRKIQENLLE